MALTRFVNSEVAKWFDLSINCLKNIFSNLNSNNLYNKMVEEIETYVYNIDMSLGKLWSHESYRNIILDYLPHIEETPILKGILSSSLRKLINLLPNEYKEDVVLNINGRLKKIVYNLDSRNS